MAGRNARTSGTLVSDSVRQQQAVELAAQGKSYDEIAVACGYKGRSGAYGAVQSVLSRADYAAADGLRNIQGLQINTLERSLLKRYRELEAMGAGTTDLSLKVADRLVRLWERRARLFGLDAPVKVDATVRSEVDAEIAALAEVLGIGAGPVPIEP